MGTFRSNTLQPRQGRQKFLVERGKCSLATNPMQYLSPLPGLGEFDVDMSHGLRHGLTSAAPAGAGAATPLLTKSAKLELTGDQKQLPDWDT